MKIFILEDDSTRIQEFLKLPATLYIRSDVEKAKTLYTENQPFDLLLLDHDLADDHYAALESSEYKEQEGTGLEFVKWLCTEGNSINKPFVIIHSWNPIGRVRMHKHLWDHDWPSGMGVFGPSLIKHVFELIKDKENK